MAKFHNGSLVLDPNDKIKFVDSIGQEHTIFWDDILEKFLINGDIDADSYIGAAHSVINNRNPDSGDNDHLISTIWINNVTKDTFLLIGKDNGSADWRFIVGQGGIAGTVEIADEGVSVEKATKKINFIGDSVNVSTDGTGNVNVHIPPYPYNSHWDTGDNIIPDIDADFRKIGMPVDDEYNVGDITENDVYPSTNKKLWVYQSPTKCLFDNLTTDFVVKLEKYGSSSHIEVGLTNINKNSTIQNNGIKIDITNWEPQASKYIADVKVTIDIDNVPNSGIGIYTITLSHINNTVIRTKTQSLFYDTNDILPSISDISFGMTDDVNIKYVSGIPYFMTGTNFNIGIGNIDNINRFTYPPVFLEIYLASLGIDNIQLTSSFLDNYTPLYNLTGASYGGRAAIQRIDYRYFGDIQISVRWVDWINGPFVNSDITKILIDTYSDKSDGLNEYFVDENYRLYANYTSFISGNLLNSDDLLIFDGKLQRQFGSWTDHIPVTVPTDYTTSLENQYYLRGFKDNGISHSNGELFIDGITEQDISNNDVIIEISLNGVDWFILNDQYFSGILNNGDGCRTDVGNISLPYIKFTLGTGGSTTEHTGPEGWGIYFKISLPNGSLVKINEVRFIDWGT